jgi:hypothetical protein
MGKVELQCNQYTRRSSFVTVKNNTTIQNSRPIKRQAERGGAIVFILIGIALFAALSYSVADMMRTGSPETVALERSKLYAAEIIDYSRAIKQTVQSLRIDGCGDTGISFTQEASDDYEHNPVVAESCKVFAQTGGGMNVQLPHEDINDRAPYIFTGLHEIHNVGTTCGSAACSDLVLVLTDIKQIVCEAINEQIGVTPANTAPPTDTGAAVASLYTPFTGTYGAGVVLGDEAAPLAGRQSGCFQDTTNSNFVFYYVLKAR